MCLAVCLFACMNTVVKVLSPHFSSVQIVWARTLGHLLFVLALFLPRHGLDIIRSQQLGSQLGRSLLQVASTMLYFTALASTGVPSLKVTLGRSFTTSVCGSAHSCDSASRGTSSSLEL